MVNEIKTFEERKEELVKLGKEKGFITYEELAASLKGLELTGEELDELYNLFSDNDIKIISDMCLSNEEVMTFKRYGSVSTSNL